MGQVLDWESEAGMTHNIKRPACFLTNNPTDNLQTKTFNLQSTESNKPLCQLLGNQDKSKNTIGHMTYPIWFEKSAFLMSFSLTENYINIKSYHVTYFKLKEI